MASTYRHPAGDVRVIEILDARADRVTAKITVPWQDPEELEAGYRADMAAGPAGDVSSWDLTRIRLARPDLVAHQLGWDTLADWMEWPDGTSRSSRRSAPTTTRRWTLSAGVRSSGSPDVPAGSIPYSLETWKSASPMTG
jgi:hypothetical protein